MDAGPPVLRCLIIVVKGEWQTVEPGRHPADNQASEGAMRLGPEGLIQPWFDLVDERYTAVQERVVTAP